ncbi:CdaR family protein [Psychrobacillus sp. FSL W7-1457]|uniref:CdaR family protein n=1 Tax=unclassified Psychrobacillus TaxID=2636677 RepID=UPI0030FCF88C
MDKMMNNPWLLRIITLTFAILLFVSVKSDLESDHQNSSNNAIDVLRDVPVEVYYDDENLVVTGVPDTVDVNIQGPANFVTSAKIMKDYKLFVDLRELPMGEHRVAISQENFSEKLKVRTDPVYVNVVIEEKITQEFRVDLDMNESLLAENYVMTSSVEPRTVNVTGAKSVIQSIGYVKATISSEKGIDKSFEQEASVRVLDLDLNKLDVSVEPRTVNVKVTVEEYSKEVPISLSKKGTPKEGLTINALSTATQKVRVYGPRSVVDKIDRLNVDVDVSKIEDTGSISVKMVVPEGVTKLSQEKIDIKADVTSATPPSNGTDEAEKEDEDTAVADEITEKSFTEMRIAVKGLPEQLASSFETPTDGIISVVAKGTPDALKDIQSGDISIYVDAQNIEVGERILPIQIDGPSNVEWQTSESEAKLMIKDA